VVEADLRRPQEILDHPETRKLIDFGRPVAVLLVAVLHFFGSDDYPAAILAAICEAIPRLVATADGHGRVRIGL
jgi:hypothetical protein